MFAHDSHTYLTGADGRKYGCETHKSDRNLKERRFDFQFAATIFMSEYTWRDSSAEGERRYNIFGPIENHIYVVTYTERGENGELTWIISARRAERWEIDEWRKSIS